VVAVKIFGLIKKAPTFTQVESVKPNLVYLKTNGLIIGGTSMKQNEHIYHFETSKQIRTFIDKIRERDLGVGFHIDRTDITVGIVKNEESLETLAKDIKHGTE
jgi:hypothetical protein